MALFDFLPQMESFAAFGIKAQWRKKLDEAEQILEQLKQSTKASAQLGYYLLGWGSRMGGRTTRKKRDVADQIDKAVTSLGIDPDTLATFKRDYLFFARYDLFDRFDAIASLNIRANKLPQSQRSAYWKCHRTSIFGHSVTAAYRRPTFLRRTQQSWESLRIKSPISKRSAIEPAGSPMRLSS
jgi:hypothetical protein